MKTMIVAAAAVLALSGCSRVEHALSVLVGEDSMFPRNTYTLYRNGPILGLPERVHVATFNAAEPAAYNRDNCQRAAGLFPQQQGVISTFWCERGEYQP